MKHMSDTIGRALAVSSLVGLLAAGCASNRTDVDEQTRDREQKNDRRAADTVYYPETGGGSGTGGTGDMPPSDPTATDTAGIYGDPNAWPTGPLPSDTGIGGAGTPMPDTMWTDTASPSDIFQLDGGREPDGVPGGGGGPDIW